MESSGSAETFEQRGKRGRMSTPSPQGGGTGTSSASPASPLAPPAASSLSDPSVVPAAAVPTDEHSPSPPSPSQGAQEAEPTPPRTPPAGPAVPPQPSEQSDSGTPDTQTDAAESGGPAEDGKNEPKDPTEEEQSVSGDPAEAGSESQAVDQAPVPAGGETTEATEETNSAEASAETGDAEIPSEGRNSEQDGDADAEKEGEKPSAYEQITKLLDQLSQEELAALSRAIPLAALRNFTAATQKELEEDELKELEGIEAYYSTHLPSTTSSRGLQHSPTIQAFPNGTEKSVSESFSTPRPPRASFSRSVSRSHIPRSPSSTQSFQGSGLSSLPEPGSPRSGAHPPPSSPSTSTLSTSVVAASSSTSRLGPRPPQPPSAISSPGGVQGSGGAAAGLRGSPPGKGLSVEADSRSGFDEKRDRVRKKLLGDIVVTEQSYTENLEILFSSYIHPLQAKATRRFGAPLTKEDAALLAGNLEHIVQFHKEVLMPQIVEQYGLEEGKQDFAELFIRNSKRLNELYTAWTKDAKARTALFQRLMKQNRFAKTITELRNKQESSAASGSVASPGRRSRASPPGSPAPPGGSTGGPNANLLGDDEENGLEQSFQLPQQRILDYLKMLWQLQQYGGRDPKLQTRLTEAMNCIKSISAAIGNAPPAF